MVVCFSKGFPKWSHRQSSFCFAGGLNRLGWLFTETPVIWLWLQTGLFTRPFCMDLRLTLHRWKRFDCWKRVALSLRMVLRCAKTLNSSANWSTTCSFTTYLDALTVFPFIPLPNLYSPTWESSNGCRAKQGYRAVLAGTWDLFHKFYHRTIVPFMVYLHGWGVVEGLIPTYDQFLGFLSYQFLNVLFCPRPLGLNKFLCPNPMIPYLSGTNSSALEVEFLLSFPIPRIGRFSISTQAVFNSFANHC